jgi:hypothetical protein
VTLLTNGKKTTQTVTTGLAGDTSTQIVGGLKAGDVVVLPTVRASTGTSSTSSRTGSLGGSTGGLGGSGFGGGGFGGGGGLGGGGFGGGG